MSGIFEDFGTTKVSGPGQKCRANVSASSGQSAAQVRAMVAVATWTINGLEDGLPLAR
jgi:hypothetical protein